MNLPAMFMDRNAQPGRPSLQSQAPMGRSKGVSKITIH